MRVSIIGAGKMGRWFTKFFLEEGMQVIVSDKNPDTLSKIKSELQVEIADNKTAVEKADLVLICVLMEDFQNVIKEISPYVRPDHVIMDICTFKEFPVQTMHKYIKNGIKLGMHPGFSPSAKSVKNQNFILTPTNSKEAKFAYVFKRWLEGKQARAFITSPRKHDRYMTVILTLPRLPFIILWEMNKRFPRLVSVLHLAMYVM